MKIKNNLNSKPVIQKQKNESQIILIYNPAAKTRIQSKIQIDYIIGLLDYEELDYFLHSPACCCVVLKIAKTHSGRRMHTV